jgi:hypothetical protein
MDPTKEQHKMLSKFWKRCDGNPDNDNTSVRGKKPETYTERPKSPRPKKARHVKSKVKSMVIILFDIKGIIHKELVVLAGQTVNSALL